MKVSVVPVSATLVDPPVLSDGESGDIIVGGGCGDSLVGDRVKVVIGASVVDAYCNSRVDVSINKVVINAGHGHGLRCVPVAACKGQLGVFGCFTGVTGGDGEDNI